MSSSIVSHERGDIELCFDGLVARLTHDGSPHQNVGGTTRSEEHPRAVVCSTPAATTKDPSAVAAQVTIAPGKTPGVSPAQSPWGAGTERRSQNRGQRAPIVEEQVTSGGDAVRLAHYISVVPSAMPCLVV